MEFFNDRAFVRIFLKMSDIDFDFAFYSLVRITND